jgi:hypothetical protein
VATEKDASFRTQVRPKKRNQSIIIPQTSRRMKIAAALLVVLPSMANASGCHGMSRFELAPAHKRSGSAFAKEVEKEASVEAKSKLCEIEYGKGAQLMDLEQMEGEFPVATDLQHALTPLFDENPDMVFYVADHGADNDGTNKFVLKMEANETNNNNNNNNNRIQRVAGPVFLELDTGANADAVADILCYIPKPEYVSTTMTMSSMMSSSDDDSSSSSWGMTFLSGLVLAGVGVAVVQAYKAKMARETSSAFGPGPSLDVGGSYRILSSNESELAQQLAPGESELV